MKISDFKAGQTVYSLEINNIGKEKFFVQKDVVCKIGRKYVTTANMYRNTYYAENPEDEFLVLKRGWGNRVYLFPTMEALEKFKNQKQIINEGEKSNAN